MTFRLPALPGMLLAPALLALAACGDSGTATAPAMDLDLEPEPNASAPAAGPVSDVHADANLEGRRNTVAAILHQHTAVMAADEFEGRAPATRGGQMTIDYLSEQFSALGAGPGNGDSYRQQVDVVEITATTDPVLQFSGSFKASPAYKSEMVIGSRHHASPVSVEDSEVVFVGYGIVAPERGWNDYANVDAAGKTVVALVNDPGYATQDPDLFNGNAMTWYGRWVYKLGIIYLI